MAYTLTEIGVPEFHFDLEKNNASATRKFRMTPWSSLDEAISDLAGGSLSIGQLMIVTQPLKYPGKPYLWLLGIKAAPFFECVGDEDANGIPEDPTGAELTLEYRSPTFETDKKQGLTLPGDTYVTFERSQSVEYASEDTQGVYYDARYGGGTPYTAGGLSVVIDGDTFYYGGGLVPVDTKIGAVVAIADIRVTWYRVKDPPWRAIMALQGTVNNDTFLDYDAEQVMFVGCTDRRQFQVDGSDTWQLTYQFNVRIPKFRASSLASNKLVSKLPGGVVAGGWNHFPRKGTQVLLGDPTWQKIYRNKGTEDDPQQDKDLLYIPTDFRLLFQPDPSSTVDAVD